jgi:hypothetical protein
MDKPVVRFAVATAVVAAVALGLFEFIPRYQSGVVRAQEKKAEEKKQEETGLGFTCRSRVTERQPGSPTPRETTEMVRESPQYGNRVDCYEQDKLTRSLYHNYGDGTVICLSHRTKTYTRQNGPKGPPPAGETLDPRPRIKKALAGEHKKLGRRTIDGVEAEGIEAPGISGKVVGAWGSTSMGMGRGGPRSSGKRGGPSSSIKVGGAGNATPGSGGNDKPNAKSDVSAVSQFWSSVETGLPILVEENAVVGGNNGYRVKRIKDQFRWNVPFDPNEFQARIPAGYQLMELPQPGQGGFGRGAMTSPAGTPQSGQKARK